MAGLKENLRRSISDHFGSYARPAWRPRQASDRFRALPEADKPHLAQSRACPERHAVGCPVGPDELKSRRQHPAWEWDVGGPVGPKVQTEEQRKDPAEPLEATGGPWRGEHGCLSLPAWADHGSEACGGAEHQAQ